MKLLDCWADHFLSLGKSQSIHNTVLQTSERNVNEYICQHQSKGATTSLIPTCLLRKLNMQFMHSLKRGRSGCFDGLSPEHLKFSGPVFRNWLCQIYNQICQLEMIPKCFKHGIIILVHKGKGRDPLLKKNYRGISPLLVSCLKFLRSFSKRE